MSSSIIFLTNLTVRVIMQIKSKGASRFEERLFVYIRFKLWSFTLVELLIFWSEIIET